MGHIQADLLLSLEPLMRMNPKTSICTVNYNGLKYLSACFESNDRMDLISEQPILWTRV